MRGKDVKKRIRDARDAFRNSRQKIIDTMIETARTTAVAVIFIGTILAIELTVWGLCIVICGRW